MFSRIFGRTNESYTDTPETTGTKQIQRHFETPQNTNIYTNDPSVPLATLTETVNTQFTQKVPILTAGLIKKSLSGELLVQRQVACEGSSGDQFDHLVSLENGFNPSSQLRCGWMYNTQNPANGRGALGTKEGPYNTPARGIWMWDLTAAKEKYHRSICDKVKNCEDLATYPYRDRCGWCSSSGKAVPIQNNRVAYPSNPNTTCSDTDLITSTSSCPAGTPAGQTWKYLANGRLPRDALVVKAEQAGCSDSGTLIQALRSGSDTNYLDTLIPTQAFSVYQERAAVGLNVNALKTGALTINSALDEFNRVNEQASSSVDSGLRYAARDLCIKKGTINEFDFCTEILDSARGPYVLDCLQKEFLRQGGQKSGTMYPSAANVATWNSQSTWFNVKTMIQGLQAATMSKDRPTQEQAIMKYYGIPIEKKVTLGAIPGVEIFWFSHPANFVITDPTIFLGRRIRSTIPFVNQSNDLKGTINRDLVSMVFFTQYVSPQTTNTHFRVTSDDGFAVEFNRALGINYKNGLTVNNANSLVALGYFPPTTFTTQAPWAIQAGPNLLSGYWFQGYGGLYFKMEYKHADNTWSEVESNALNLTQEAYAPMISFEVYSDPQNFGADFNFADTRMGGLKMKWTSLTGTPTWVYSNGPMNLPVVKFRNDSSMKLVSPFKIYSFMTMTILMSFTALPNNSVNMEEYISMPGNLGKIAIRVVGNGTYGQGTLQLYTEGGGDAPRTTTVRTVRQGYMYLLVLRVNRTNESDIYSVNGVSLGAEELNILQGSSSFEYSAQVTFSNPRAFSNPDTMESRTMIIGNGYITIVRVRLYDYFLDSTGIKREANNTWLRL